MFNDMSSIQMVSILPIPRVFGAELKGLALAVSMARQVLSYELPKPTERLRNWCYPITS